MAPPRPVTLCLLGLATALSWAPAPRTRPRPSDALRSCVSPRRLGSLVPCDEAPWEPVWERWANADVLTPEVTRELPLPVAVVHLIGGTLVGVNPAANYNSLACGLAERGFLVICTRLPLSAADSFDHTKLCSIAARDFRQAWRGVEARYGPAAANRLALFGVGHSLGAKLHLLMNSYPEVAAVASPVPRVANAFVAFNNFGATQSVPLLRGLRRMNQGLNEIGARTAGVAENVLTDLFEDVEDYEPSKTPEKTRRGVRSWDADAQGREEARREAREFLSKASQTASQATRVMQSALDPEDVLKDASNVVKRVASWLGDPEFRPSPAETEAMVAARYAVPVNLLVRFAEDPLDQTLTLADLLLQRFGAFGVEAGSPRQYMELEGNHYTPTDSTEFTDLGVWTDDGTSGDPELEDLVESLTWFLSEQAVWKHEGEREGVVGVAVHSDVVVEDTTSGGLAGTAARGSVEETTAENIHERPSDL